MLFRSFNDNIKPENVDKDILIEMLKEEFGIEIPHTAGFNKIDVGRYQWTVKKDAVANQFIEGTLFVAYYNDNTIKEIRNNLVELSKEKNVSIISETEAYKQLSEGKFRVFYGNSIHTIDIYKVELDYLLDSKGFYQPVYLFESSIDGMNTTIVIPALP